MDAQVLSFIKDRKLIKKNSKVLVAVSGGPDSLALLHFLWSHQHRLGIVLSAVTIDHQLRGATSAADARYVKDICTDWQIPCAVIKVDVNQYQKTHRVGTQVAARNLRYNAFRYQMEREAVDCLAFGHHADDQIETVLMALTRTTHLHNLTGMPDERKFASGKIIRPFLCIDQTEIRNYIATHHLSPRIDASNFEKDYTRNRMRADVVPLLKKENPNLAVTVGKLSESLQEDDRHLSEQAKRAFGQSVEIKERHSGAVIDIQKLQMYPVSLQRRVFRLTLDYLYYTLPEQLSYKHEEMLLDLLGESRNRMMDFPGHMQAERAYNSIYLYFSNGQGQARKAHLLESTSATVYLQDGTIISCSVIAAEKLQAKSDFANTYIFSESAVHFPLVVRTRQAGDRMTYDGLNGTKKLKKIFIDEKIPRHERASWPILTDAHGEVLWLIGLRKNTKQISKASHYACIKVHRR